MGTAVSKYECMDITKNNIKEYPATHNDLVNELKQINQNGPKLVQWLIKLIQANPISFLESDKTRLNKFFLGGEIDFNRNDYGIVRYDVQEECFIIEVLKYSDSTGLELNENINLEDPKINDINNFPVCVLFKDKLTSHVDLFLI